MITLISRIKKMIHELTNKSDTHSQVVKKNGYQRENNAEVGRGINQGLGISIMLYICKTTVWYRGHYSVFCNTLYGEESGKE